MKTANETYEDICEEYGVTMPPIWVRDVHLKAMKQHVKQACKENINRIQLLSFNDDIRNDFEDGYNQAIRDAIRYINNPELP